MKVLGSSEDKSDNIILNNYNHKNSNDELELEKLYQIYLQVQSGDKIALNKLFQQSNKNQINKADELNKEYRFSHMDNILDSELVLEQERRRQEEAWTSSHYSKITFSFLCLNQMLYNKKKQLLSKTKNTGYKDGKKKKGHIKFYEGIYDISDLNELIYETIIEIFTTKTDENHYLTLNDKKSNIPIFDGSSLLKNISYFTSRKINKKAATSYLDIADVCYYKEDFSCEEEKEIFSYFDEYAKKEYLELNSSISRFGIYGECLEWLKRNNIFNLFKANSCEIKAIIETIMNEEKVFLNEENTDIQGMRFISQRALQAIIQFRYHIYIETSNLSKNMKLIEQRLLDHLFYSLNYKIGKARETEEYKKESERFLYELDKKYYIKIFSRLSYEIYDKSIQFLNNIDFYNYLNLLNKQEDKIISILSLSKGKKKYDMLNLILKNYDLVEDRKETMRNIAETILFYYQKEEIKYQKEELKNYKIKSFLDWEKAYWEAELESNILKIRLWSSKNIKHPILNRIKKENVMIYCGCANFYFCDKTKEICYKLPKQKRIISISNKDHEVSMYSMV